MLQNYFLVDENQTIGTFLKDAKDRTNIQYIILDTQPRSFVEVRTVAFKIHNHNEKLKGLKKPLSLSKKGKSEAEHLQFLIETGDRVIDIEGDGLFDFVDGLEIIYKENPDFLKAQLKDFSKEELMSLGPDEKISTARNLFMKKRINLLPIVEDDQLIGEVRPRDFLVTDLFMRNREERGGQAYYQMAAYTEHFEDTTLNVEVRNIMNNDPVTINYDKNLKDAVELMISKRLPSLIITDRENKLFSVLSYGDVFRLYQDGEKRVYYSMEFVGTNNIREDDLDLIQDFVQRTMDKIAKMSKYNDLKITFKTHGQTNGSKAKKFSVNLLLSEGKKVLQVSKEMQDSHEGDPEMRERSTDTAKNNWNFNTLIKDALNALEKLVKDEVKKRG